MGLIEDERPTRGGNVELVADGKPRMQEAAGRALRFTLDGDPVVARVGRSGERVVAEHRSLLLVGLEAHREELPRAGGGQADALRILESYGDHRLALARDGRDHQSTEPRPRWRRARCHQASVAAAGLAVEQSAERRLPPWTEGGNSERP